MPLPSDAPRMLTSRAAAAAAGCTRWEPSSGGQCMGCRPPTGATCARISPPRAIRDARTRRGGDRGRGQLHRRDARRCGCGRGARVAALVRRSRAATWRSRTRRARASSSSRRTWAASRSPRRTRAQQFPITVLYRAPKLAWLQPLIEQGRGRGQRAPRARRRDRRARAARGAASAGKRSASCPTRCRARARASGRVLRQARLHHDARAQARGAPRSIGLPPRVGERLPRGRAATCSPPAAAAADAREREPGARA